MGKTTWRNVLALYSLADKACRDHFCGVLDAMADTSNWHLFTSWPELLFSDGNHALRKSADYDGYIIAIPGPAKVMRELSKSKTPTVLVNITDQNLSARTHAVSFVWTDNADIGRCGAEHLLKRGSYKSVGYVHELKYEFYSYEREIAYRNRMKEAGYKSTSFPPDKDFSDYQTRLRDWIHRLPKPAAIMAVSDMRAADVINACRETGILVPEQVAVVGVDNDSAQHEKCGMGISSVLPDFRLMGRIAAKELQFLFQHPKTRGRPHEILVPVKEVITRESSTRSIPAIQLVEHAMSFIRTNSARDLKRRDVAAHLGCSLQLVELRFRQILGSTIRATIATTRLEEAARRLKSSHVTVRQIAQEMHFNSASHLSRVFRRHFGCTITETRA